MTDNEKTDWFSKSIEDAQRELKDKKIPSDVIALLDKRRLSSEELSPKELRAMSSSLMDAMSSDTKKKEKK